MGPGLLIDLQMDHFESARKNEKLESVWSIYTVGTYIITNVYNIAEDYQDAKENVYYGDATPIQLIEWPSIRWIDLWRAADKAIVQSGDQHHMFIEWFRPRDSGQYEVVTGS